MQYEITKSYFRVIVTYDSIPYMQDGLLTTASSRSLYVLVGLPSMLPPTLVTVTPADPPNASGAPAHHKTMVINDILEAHNRAGRSNTHCVLFVHGLNGDFRKTWKTNEDAAGFVELLLQDESLQDFDVYSFGYRSTFFRGAPIDNAAKQLDVAVRAIDKRYRIVLLAHSMGGLVCMRYILNQLENNIPPPVCGLSLFGCPTTGSDLLKYAKIVGYEIGTKVPFVRGALNLFFRYQRQITDLEAGSDFLHRIHDAWSFRVLNGGHPDAKAGRMWLPVRVITGEDDSVVTESSGKSFYGAIDWRPLSYGHILMVKPEAMNDPRYQAAHSFLQICRLEKDRNVLDSIWQASQDVWQTRVGRLSEDLIFDTYIDDGSFDPPPTCMPCSATCSYSFVLEAPHVEFGIALGDHVRAELWRRSPQPIYIHQIGLALIPEAERDRFREIIESYFDSDDEEKTWLGLFPKLELKIDKQILAPLDFQWDAPAKRKLSKWLLRRYDVPRDKIGKKVRLEISYQSFVPKAVGYFAFSPPG